MRALESIFAALSQLIPENEVSHMKAPRLPYKLRQLVTIHQFNLPVFQLNNASHFPAWLGCLQLDGQADCIIQRLLCHGIGRYLVT